MPEYLLGMEAKMYYGASGSSASTELTNVRDVTLSLEAGEADTTTRANSGWRSTAPTLREATVEFEMVWKPDDAGFAAIKNAFLNNALIALKVLDDEDGEGLDGDFAITQFSRGEPLEEAIIVSVTARLSVFREWVGGTGT